MTTKLCIRKNSFFGERTIAWILSHSHGGSIAPHEFGLSRYASSVDSQVEALQVDLFYVSTVNETP